MSSLDTVAADHLRQLEMDRLLANEEQGLEAALSHLADREACRDQFEKQQREQRAYIEPRAQVESAKLISLAAKCVQTENCRRMLSTIGSLAAAAAVAFVCAIVFTRREPLPEYAYSVSHSSISLRGGEWAAPKVPRFAPHSRLSIDLRPVKAGKGAFSGQHN